jgi:hypothetical protein
MVWECGLNAYKQEGVKNKGLLTAIIATAVQF